MQRVSIDRNANGACKRKERTRHIMKTKAR